MKRTFVARALGRLNPLTVRYLLIGLAPLAAGTACACGVAVMAPGAALLAAAAGLLGGASVGVPVVGYFAAATARRITVARVQADLLGGELAEVAGDDLERLTRRLDRIAGQLKQSEESLAAAQAEARRAAGARLEFLAAMNHELRTPLNAILGFGQVLDMSPSLAADERDSLHQVLRAGRHLLRLVNELLQISDAEGGAAALSPEPVQLAEIVSETLDLVSPMAAHRRISIDASAAANRDAWVTADRQRLQQVLMNLLSNAVKFNHEAGQVAIDAERVADRWRVSVTDSGPGLDGGDRRRLFAPFDRLDADRKGIEGTGLGLALAKGLIERMGGAIGVESEPGAGSRFWIELPVAEAPRAPSHPARHVEPGATVVLHVEDNPANQHLVQRVLEKEGLRVMSAMQGRLGVALALDHRPSLILLDLNLPDTHGLDVLRALAGDTRTAQVPVIVVTADVTPGQRSKAIALGAVAVLTKPLDISKFLETVSLHVSGIGEPCPRG